MKCTNGGAQIQTSWERQKCKATMRSGKDWVKGGNTPIQLHRDAVRAPCSVTSAQDSVRHIIGIQQMFMESTASLTKGT